MEELFQNLKFDAQELIPVIARDVDTREIVMMAYANKEAVTKTIDTGIAHYYSRSRQNLWLKGETSGHTQKIHSIQVDCDGDALIYNIRQTGVACHTGAYSCFYRNLDKDKGLIELEGAKIRPESSNIGLILDELYGIIENRKGNPQEGSYTTYLFQKGLDKILKKVGEETAEVIIGAKNGSKEELTYEASDLIYHLLVLLVESGVNLQDIHNELLKRRK